MKFTSGIPCEFVSENNGKVFNCKRGAEYTYNNTKVCKQHLSKILTDCYIFDHPECMLQMEVRVGKQVYRLTPDKIAELCSLLDEQANRKE